jgi:hypothetical protein
MSILTEARRYASLNPYTMYTKFTRLIINKNDLIKLKNLISSKEEQEYEKNKLIRNLF